MEKSKERQLVQKLQREATCVKTCDLFIILICSRAIDFHSFVSLAQVSDFKVKMSNNFIVCSGIFFSHY